MAYVVYNIESTKLLRTPSGGVGCYKTHYASEAAAKSALTRAVKKGKVVASEYAVAEFNTFQNTIEKTETVRNLMTGQPVVQSVNTPRCCDPSSELYWSM